MSRRNVGPQGPGLNVGYGNYDYSNSNGDAAKRNVSNPYGKDAKKKQYSSTAPSILLKFLPWVLSVVLFLLFLLTRNQLSNANQKLIKSERVLRDEVQSCSRRLKELNTSATSLKEAMAKKTMDVSRMRSDWEQEKSKLGAELKTKTLGAQSAAAYQAEVSVWKTREKAWISRIHLLTQKIERESYREALEVFGAGPHRARFYVDVPRDSEKDAMIPDGEYPSFVIELHSLESMPHSVHLFLEQVYHGLWDGCSFVVNAPHILQAGTFPGGNAVVTYAEKIKAFEDVGLDVVSYQEYSKEYPHQQWTVGFAGRPGGPDFYINKLDNTNNHGPGGQSQHHLEEEADPCFGFVVEGKDVLERMYGMKTDAKNDWILDNPVHIVKARIVDKSDDSKTIDSKHAEVIPGLSKMHGDPRIIPDAEDKEIRDVKGNPPLPKLDDERTKLLAPEPMDPNKTPLP